MEGRYDAAALAGLVEGLILTTGGFSIFTNEEQKALIRRLGAARGLVILTDSDAAGFRIRRYVEQIAAGCNVKHAYVPALPGKERRKPQPGREGLLGVEGLPPALLRQALERAGVAALPALPGEAISPTDLYEWGLSGTAGSAQRRRAALQKLGLPPRLSKRALCRVLGSLYTRSQLEELLR